MVRFRGQGENFPDDPKITWSVAEGSEKYVEISEGTDETRCIVTPKYSGTGYVVATCEGVGNLVIAVNISKTGKFVASDIRITYTGKAWVDVIDSESMADIPRSTLTFKSNNTTSLT